MALFEPGSYVYMAVAVTLVVYAIAAWDDGPWL